MSNSDTVIKITNLAKEYKMYWGRKARLLEAVLPGYKKHEVFRAIDDLNLEIHKGEVLGILGKNGAGKSTLLKMITGVVFPTSGTLEVNGKISSLLELGTAFNPELTGYENIYQHGQIMGLSNDEIKLKEKEIIEFADIGEHLEQPVKTYSSGMFARLAFACAINVDPDILIVDEVLSVGDMAFQLKCFKKFEEFKEKGKTILFVTHSVADVIRNCNRTIIISSGKKIFDGSVKDGVEKYKKMIVGLDEDGAQDKQVTKLEKNQTEEIAENGQAWKDHFTKNDNLITYGNGRAEIIDYGIFDLDGEYQPTINNNDEYVVKAKIKFHDDIDEPIFAMSIKDIKGMEYGGCNTKVYKVITGNYKAGDTVVVEYKQTIPLAPGNYAFSFGCTKYKPNGELEVFDRKYDSLLVEIISFRDCLGFMDFKTEIKVIREDGENVN